MITDEARQKITDISLDIITALTKVDKFVMYVDSFSQEVFSVIPEESKASFSYQESLNLLKDLNLRSI
jgi:hypothetical protein